MVSLLGDNFISLGEVACLPEFCRNGKPANSQQLIRWARRGVRLDDGTRIRLPLVKHGRQQMCRASDAIAFARRIKQ